MKNIWINIKKELFLFLRLKSTYFLLILCVLYAIASTFTQRDYVMYLVDEGMVSSSYMASQNQFIFHSLYQYFFQAMPFIATQVGISIIFVDLKTFSLRLKNVVYEYKEYMNAKIILTFLFGFILLIVYQISVYLSYLYFIDPLIQVKFDISLYTITVASLIIMFFYLKLVLLSMLATKITKNNLVPFVVTFTYTYVVLLVFPEFKYNLFNIGISSFLYFDRSMVELFNSALLIQPIMSLIVLLFIIVLNYIILLKVIKWQEQY